MFRHHHLFLAVLAVSISACSVREAQPRMLSGDIQCRGGSIESSADVRRFTGCQVIRGNLAITGSDLEGLAALHTVRSVSGTLTIAGNPTLGDLEGLEQLTSVGRLEIRDNPELDNVAALAGLHSMKSLVIQGNPGLKSLSGLEGLTRLERLTLDRTGLYTTTGLGNLREVEEIEVTHNAHLIDLGGLSEVASAVTVRIEQNPRLCARLGLLPALQQVEELLVLDNLGLSSAEVATLEARAEPMASSAALLSAVPPSAFAK